jgi:hypothetical protein
MKHAIEMASGGVIYIQRFLAVSSGIKLIFRILPQQFEMLQS